MKKKDLPAMPFYVGDWKKDPGVNMLTWEEKGIWFELICMMWESADRGYLRIGDHVIDKYDLSRALNLPVEKIETFLVRAKKFSLFSQQKNGCIYSRKIINILELSEKRQKAGKMGGNPCLTNGKPNGKPNTEDETEYSFFITFWKLYPKKVGKGAAEKVWKKIKKPGKILELIKQALLWQIKSDMWKKENGQYIPNPSTYLNQQRWLDEPVTQHTEKLGVLGQKGFV